MSTVTIPVVTTTTAVVTAAIENINNLPPPVKNRIIERLNNALAGGPDHDVAKQIKIHRDIIIELSSYMSVESLQKLVTQLLHAYSLTGFQSYGLAKMIKESVSRFEHEKSKRVILEDENQELHNLLESTNKTTRDNAEKLRALSNEKVKLLKTKLPTIEDFSELVDDLWK